MNNMARLIMPFVIAILQCSCYSAYYQSDLPWKWYKRQGDDGHKTLMVLGITFPIFSFLSKEKKTDTNGWLFTIFVRFNQGKWTCCILYLKDVLIFI